MKVWNDILYFLYRFSGSRLPWLHTNLYGIMLWQMETYSVNEKWEFTQSTGHGFQEDDWWYSAVCAKEDIFNLFNIPKKRWQYHTDLRLYYRCVKIWMVKIWWIFDQSSILPNFCGTKVSLHTVYSKSQGINSLLIWNIHFKVCSY